MVRRVRTSLWYQLPTAWCALDECCHLALDFSPVFRRIAAYLHTNLPGAIKDASIPHPFINTAWCSDTMCSLCSRWDYVPLSPFRLAVSSCLHSTTSKLHCEMAHAFAKQWEARYYILPS